MARLDDLIRLAEKLPHDPMTHYGVGLEYVNLGRWQDARSAFARAIEADAKYSAAYYHKARAEIQSGQPDDARATLRAGIDVAQTSGDWHTAGEMRELLATLEDA